MDEPSYRRCYKIAHIFLVPKDGKAFFYMEMQYHAIFIINGSISFPTSFYLRGKNVELVHVIFGQEIEGKQQAMCMFIRLAPARREGDG